MQQIEEYNDLCRIQIAKKQYDNELVEGKIVEIGDGDNVKLIDTVREVISDSTGLNGYVIGKPNGNITLFFQGFKGLEELDSKEDCLDHDF